MKTLIISFGALLTLGACAPAALEGETCMSDDDCAEGLECHIEDHSDHADEEDHEESGVCESHEDDHDDHDDTAHEEGDHEE